MLKRILKSLATRKSSEIFLDIISKLPNLIGGSADLAGSNNTKTKNHKIIKPGRFFRKLYSLWSQRTCDVWNNEWNSIT